MKLAFTAIAAAALLSSAAFADTRVVNQGISEAEVLAAQRAPPSQAGRRS